ncbi:hypothetical protein BDV26DRAFT_263694 [Aspergillus bertholletiae]|uniref:Uncharacterized protein n=1 Tax=Aspergillus bertholletiae TaxID=1226010 RepID=A0A5N7B771_9EURO|nr:hypothetical protein BDV26DRAFT_263694 [Aspergillus bertholletiae]
MRRSGSAEAWWKIRPGGAGRRAEGASYAEWGNVLGARSGSARGASKQPHAYRGLIAIRGNEGLALGVDLMVESKEIESLDFNRGVERWDAVCSPHLLGIVLSWSTRGSLIKRGFLFGMYLVALCQLFKLCFAFCESLNIHL